MSRHYVALTDPDDPREGEVRLGGRMGDNHWEGGTLVFHWTQTVNRCGLPPKRVQRIVDLANRQIGKVKSVESVSRGRKTSGR